jgi:chemotaxis protein methyltransferase WspC
MAGQCDRIEAILTRRIGLDPAAVGSALIPRAVRIRMNELGLNDLDSYTSLISSSESELQALIEEVVVPESWFFRDEVPFRHFQDHVRASWVANPARSPLRVMSIPCAGGEEPYSIVIALREIGLDARRYQVNAIDVSTRRLEVARRGVFSSNAFRGSDFSFRDRYFRRHPEGFEIDPSLRAQIRFRLGSILDPGLLSGESVFDVIFCRNLLIYLDEPSRVQVMSVLDRLLVTEGLLIIGHADRLNLSAIDPAFTEAGDRRAFTYRKTTGPSPTGAVAAPSVQTLTYQAPQLPSPRSRMQLTSEPTQSPGRVIASQVPEETRSGPGYRSDHTPGPQSSSHLRPGSEVAASGSLLDRASELANLGRHHEAVALCEQHVRQQGPSAPAYYLMGVIHQSLGNRSRGETCFQKAIYLDPGHDEALLALALSAERRGDATAAAGFHRRAERAMLRKGVR